MTLDQAIRAYLDRLHATGYAPRTIQTYRPHLEAFRAWADQRQVVLCQDVTLALVRAYADDLMAQTTRYGRPFSLSAQIGRLGTLKSLFAFLVRRGTLLADPTLDFELPRPPPRGFPLDVPTPREMDRLLAVPDTDTLAGLRDRAVLELLYSTGLRNAELRALRAWDVDVCEGLVTVMRGKGRKHRIVPLGREAADWVSLYLQKVRPLWAKKSEPLLFVTSGGRGLNFSNLNKLVHACARKAGLTKRVTVHTFRHACATHMLKAGADIRHLQRLLGHRSLRSTSVYTHLDLADLKRAHRRHHPRAGRRR